MELLTLVPPSDLRARVLEVRREGADGRWLFILELSWAGRPPESTDTTGRGIGVAVRITGLQPARD